MGIYVRVRTKVGFKTSLLVCILLDNVNPRTPGQPSAGLQNYSESSHCCRTLRFAVYFVVHQ